MEAWQQVPDPGPGIVPWQCWPGQPLSRPFFPGTLGLPSCPAKYVRDCTSPSEHFKVSIASFRGKIVWGFFSLILMWNNTLKFTIYGSLDIRWGRRVRDRLPPFFLSLPPWGRPLAARREPQRQHLVRQTLACQLAFSGDQASDEEKIRRLLLMRSRSGNTFS